jgi:DNA polymerase III epsilon subunit-like protein
MTKDFHNRSPTRIAWSRTGFAVVDVETTGLFPARDRIVEIGMMHDSDACLTVLDAVLEDRVITPDETSQLTQLAAWRDETVTQPEHADLLEVARLLGVPAPEIEALATAAGLRVTTSVSRKTALVVARLRQQP